MRKLSVTAALAIILTLCPSCVDFNTVVQKLGDVNIFTDAEEIQFGKTIVKQHEREVRIYTDSIVTNYVDALGQYLVQHSRRRDIRYTFKVVKKKGINAYAYPGGFIYIHLDLIRAAKNESELAAVMAHEIGHIVGRHSMKRLTKAYGVEFLKKLVLDEDSGQLYKYASDILAAGLLLKFSRDDEREADFYGVRNLYDAGIAPQGAATFFETLANIRRTEPSSLEMLFATHPHPGERMSNVYNQIRNLPPKSGLRIDTPKFHRVKRRIQ